MAALALAGCGAQATNEASTDANEAAGRELEPLPPPAPKPPPKPVRADIIPADFHGRYAASCDRPGDSRLDVSARELRFHESAAAVRSVTIQSPRSIEVAAAYQGEGERWSAVQQLRLSDDGSRLTLKSDGVEFVRIRCVDPPAPEPSTRWDVAASGEGAALFLAHFHLGGERVVTLFCPAGSGELLVNVPGFRPIGSEERMSFGAGGMVVTLVADPRGDRRRGGVTGRGPRPAELPTILGGLIAVNYGAQNAGPFAPPSAALARSFLAGCAG